jgi:hypothetical protein
MSAPDRQQNEDSMATVTKPAGTRLNEQFIAELQKSPSAGGWTYVVWP